MDHSGSPFNVLIVIQYFTTALRPTVAVPLMSSLLCSLSLWDCGPRWQAIYTVLTIIPYFTMALWPAVAVPLMSSLLCRLSLWDCRLGWQSIYTVLTIIPYFTTGLWTAVTVPLMSFMQSFTMEMRIAVAVHLYSPHYYTVFHYDNGTVDCGGSPFNVFIIMQSFTVGQRTIVAVHLYSPQCYAVFHYSIGDRGGSPFNVLIIMQSFTNGTADRSDSLHYSFCYFTTGLPSSFDTHIGKWVSTKGKP